MKKNSILKCIFGLIIIFIMLIAPTISNATSEEISDYKSDIYINEDASMIVKETIKVYAEGNQIKRGIYRDFPTQYKDKNGNNYNVEFEVLEVLRDGEKEPYEIEKQENGVRIYIGDSNNMLETGYHTYTIKYETDKQIGYFDEHDELYWNVTGNGWNFTIDNVTAIVHLPNDTNMNKVNFEAYTGRQGASEKQCTAYKDEYDNTITFTTTSKLYFGEGLTIVVRFDKEVLNGSRQEKDNEQSIFPDDIKAKDSVITSEDELLDEDEDFEADDTDNQQIDVKLIIVIAIVICVIAIACLIFWYLKINKK